MTEPKNNKNKVSEQKAEVDDPETRKKRKAEEEIEKDIEDNVKVHAMPRKYKTVSRPQSPGKTKTVGALIISLGFLFMIGMIVGGYLYFIKPQTEEGIKKTAEKRQAEESDRQNKEIESAEKQKDKEEQEKKQEEKDKDEDKKEDGGSQDKNKKEDTKETNIKSDLSSDSRSTSTEEDPTDIRKVATSTDGMATSSDETSTSTEETTQMVSAADSDNDGLLDIEEEILGSNSSSTDSDNDGYDDLSELLSLYNPVNTDKLYANDAINKYENELLGYSLLYPKAWRRSVVGENDSVVFAIGDGSFVNIIAQPNKNGQAILAWVKELLPSTEAGEDDVVEGKGWKGLFHDNGRIFYLTDDKRENIFIFDYSPARQDSLDHINIFRMMINSFELSDQ